MPSMPSLRPRGREPRPQPHIPVPVERAVVDCGVYVDGHRLRGRFSYQKALEVIRERGSGFVWLGLHAPDEGQMSGVAEVFGLHELLVEDAVHAHQRPKLELYDELKFLVLRTVKYVEHDAAEGKEVVATGELMVFTGRDFVITVRHGEHTHLTGLRRRLEERPDRLALGPDFVMHAVADLVVDTYLEVAESFEVDVDTAEENIFTPERSVDIDPIYMLKRAIIELRRSVEPLARPLQRLTSSEEPLVNKEIRRLFRDVADHHEMVSERIAGYDDVLESLLDAAQAKVGIQQNTDMRKISAWVAIASVPTVVAGIYGMNFQYMPELEWRYGFWVLMIVLLAVCGGLWWVFRKNRWL
ncbi:magnesium/cobalt transporter CorA [Gordonia jinhuaensis]|uniref:magnesium and cobalt transport protein CorA n=1 Tax=Gordonia jinhuaensis TaxID=1517702 RepID=UPI0016685DBD|nr:magnesium and cobalt transport protein CorA [Gordonia jinhuaensis]